MTGTERGIIMKCEEALTKIEAYIDHTLSGRELEEFLEHVKSCRECYDELETYYRTTVDFAQVDEAAARCAELFGLEAPSPNC